LSDTPLPFGVLRNAKLLGSPEKVNWHWSADGLEIDLPATRPSDDALVIKLS